MISVTYAQPSTDLEQLVRDDLEQRSSLVLSPHGRHNRRAHRALLQQPKAWLDTLDIILLQTHRELDKVQAEISEIKDSPFYKAEFVEATSKQEAHRSRLTRDALVAEVRRNEVERVVAMSGSEDSALTLLASALREHKRRKEGVGDEHDEALWAMIQGEWGFQ